MKLARPAARRLRIRSINMRLILEAEAKGRIETAARAACGLVIGLGKSARLAKSPTKSPALLR